MTDDNYTLKMDTFIFWRTWGEVFIDLTDEQAGLLVKAVFRYTEGTEADLESPELRSIYRLITAQLNQSSKKFLKNRGYQPGEEKSS